MNRIFNEERIDEASKAIVEAMRPALENRGGSLVNMATRSTEAYRAGLNNGEVLLAVQRALASLQVEQTARIADLFFDQVDQVSDETDAA